MSTCLEAAPPIAPSDPSTEARSARLKKLEREQLIVDYLNRGVSVAEIAARVGLGEKRMRAVIREILARRMPAPPEEFLAIQVSRLNEALLVAYSAMTGANLKAVDRVVRIVRELDRYHVTFAPAGRRLPGASDREAPAEGTAAYGAALICRAQFAPGDSGDIEFEQNMQLTLSPLERGEGWGEGLGRLAADLLPVNRETGRSGASASDDRPEIPPQTFEKTESAPGFAAEPTAEGPLAPLQGGEGCGEGVARTAGADARQAAHPSLLPVNGEKGQCSTGDNRPENSTQDLERLESSPGIATGPVARNSVWPDCYGRPENPPQDIENVDSGLTNDWADEAPPPISETSIDTPMVLTPAGWRRPNIRMTLNGVAAY